MAGDIDQIGFRTSCPFFERPPFDIISDIDRPDVETQSRSNAIYDMYALPRAYYATSRRRNSALRGHAIKRSDELLHRIQRYPSIIDTIDRARDRERVAVVFAVFSRRFQDARWEEKTFKSPFASLISNARITGIRHPRFLNVTIIDSIEFKDRAKFARARISETADGGPSSTRRVTK